MTDIATRRSAEGGTGRVLARIARLQWRLSDPIHAHGDVFARQHGWAITTTTGRLGFGGRVYHDPRFTECAPGARRGDPRGPDTGWPR
jgi:hypothetical protein